MLDKKMVSVVWVAFSWILAFTCSPSYVSANHEVDVLYTFKSSLVDPYGILESWNASLINPCTWFHVTCNGDNRVVRLDLGSADLAGKLIPELGQLENLQYLELYNNKIRGKIPYELGNLRNLVSLDLYLNNLVGPIPTTLGKLSKLRILRLNHNKLSGKIPVSLTTITTLQVLDLSYNSLSGTVPVNGSFSSFTRISFAGNPHLKMPRRKPPHHV